MSRLRAAWFRPVLIALVTGSVLLACDSGGPESPADSDPDFDNAEPNVTVQADPSEGADTLETTLTVDGSDPDGTVETYKLDSDGDGGFDISKGSPIDTTLTYAKETTVEGAVDDDAGATAQETVTIEVEDQTPPSVTASASEPDDNYGHVNGSAESNETATLTMYLVRGEDSTEVDSRSSTTSFEEDIEAAGVLGYAVGDTATISVTAEDQAGNAAFASARAAIDGHNFTADVRKATATPFSTLPPLENAYLRVKDSNGRTDTLTTGQDGIATIENLSKGTLTYQVRDEQDPTAYGDWYDTAEQQTELTQAVRDTIPLPEKTGLAPGDDHFENNLQLLLHFQQDLLRIHPNPLDGNKDYPLEIYTERVDTSDAPQAHIQAFRDCVKSWNWNDETNNIYRFVENREDAEGWLDWGDSGIKEDTIQVDHPSQHTAEPDYTCNLASQEGGQFTNLARTNDGEVPSPAYVMHQNRFERPDTPSIEERAQLGIGIDLRQTFPHLKNLREFYAQSGDVK